MKHARSRWMGRMAAALAAAALLVALAPALAGAQGPVEVRVSGWGGTDIAIVEELVSRFVQPAVEGEGIKVVYEPVAEAFDAYLFNALSAGTAPDLFYVDIFWSEALFRAGQVEPLNAYLNASDRLKASDILPNLIEGFTLGGKVYGIPKDFNTLGTFYNKDLFDEAGVPYPDVNDDWNSLADKLRQVAEATGVEGTALIPKFERFGAFAYAAGFRPFDASGRTDLSQPGFRQAFDWYTGLVKDGLAVQPADIGADWSGSAFANEQIAVAFEGAWMLGFLRDQAPNLHYGVAPMPKAPGTGQRGNMIYTVSWSMNAASEHKQEAFRVLEELTSPEAQQWVLERGLALPSRASLAQNPYFHQQAVEAQANRVIFEGASDGNVHPFKFRQYGGDWMNPINDALGAVMNNELSPEQALREAQSRLDDLTGR
ncbi:ABC transporter substrate-binding protein [Limnochorda pilosa]|uniref:ABC transporter substrate-binding protein n=1 Tax=Limnochorda pilosa TaxID=1555112 RepID=A0A0K2SFQ5_LIMPI|nr:ABC transporter substrate-binding protein [Limnochorda pilosa]BAS25936.1 ABC transporter substrate-binding protein [Limnochorda pilosa]